MGMAGPNPADARTEYEGSGGRDGQFNRARPAIFLISAGQGEGRLLGPLRQVGEQGTDRIGDEPGGADWEFWSGI